MNGPQSADVHFHHLDGDPKHTVFENLLPISADLNGAIERNREHVQLQPGYLLAQAQHLYRGNHFARAYGCARLAGFLSSDVARFDLAIEASAKCIAYLRAIRAPDLLLDVVTRSATPAIAAGGSEIGFLSLATLCEHVANLFREQRWPGEYAQWRDLARVLLERTFVSPDSRTLAAQHIRHEAFHLLDIDQPDRASQAMQLAQEVAPTDWEWDRKVTAGNQGLWTAHHELLKGRPDHAAEELRKLKQRQILLSDDELHFLTPSPISGPINTKFDVRSQVSMQTLLAQVEWDMGRQRQALDRVHSFYALFQRPPHLLPTRADAFPVLDSYAARYDPSRAWLDTVVSSKLQAGSLAFRRLFDAITHALSLPRKTLALKLTTE